MQVAKGIILKKMLSFFNYKYVIECDLYDLILLLIYKYVSTYLTKVWRQGYIYPVWLGIWLMHTMEECFDVKAVHCGNGNIP